MFNRLLSPVTITDIIDIILVASLFYGLFILIKGTRAVQGLKVLGVLVIASFIAQFFQLHTINWLLRGLWMVLPLAFLILFQPEFRRVIGEIDKNYLWGILFKQEKRLISEIIEAAISLSKRKIGALIVLQQNISLKHYIDTGVRVDAETSSELLNTIFFPGSPLHDGAAIIQGNRIMACSCILPLSQNPDMEKPRGTRHRAAIGLSEETDSLVVVVSEETGDISLALNGKIVHGLDEEGLTEMLTLYRSKEATAASGEVK
ncbi:TIGR00159 family protein [Candidatus Desantisbacteria bacterium CG2_30_40_21]|uniref:Diadenylate cyclase n=5 Tax=unclassified Candidatus Desantisiibacteriota TaxID=3106372 RepID=A0A2M7JD51_9BACT|nr:MAG: TIGR00159 family protein [Candidatus Desantisbacteria bacterium CG2_30_40_21]PIP42115.1 MAG: TIGR00159 family protein [Candidatus Desantisbacteria bacterium CG23_combo_of_CG06-09_8_20_14_all_40_23]PIX17296.1 MAG: TIGR00159 family protein [Candidatus Desantisbacteria bacterium CG_4_8_14_3_um_filter_40_12]PIY20073.1 MAG: TIGR00159 family protein [Candidatus Desantisbacteria bacterium CG_4_10_14_3_um_filter_40_18]PJB29253.1 MAG: TIGR00159 family protein [Candidatus Desantisbacteria bacteri